MSFLLISAIRCIAGVRSSVATVYIPESVYKINLFLTAVCAGGAGILSSDFQIGLLKKSDQVVGTGSVVLAGKLKR